MTRNSASPATQKRGLEMRPTPPTVLQFHPHLTYHCTASCPVHRHPQLHNFSRSIESQRERKSGRKNRTWVEMAEIQTISGKIKVFFHITLTINEWWWPGKKQNTHTVSGLTGNPFDIAEHSIPMVLLCCLCQCNVRHQSAPETGSAGWATKIVGEQSSTGCFKCGQEEEE